MLMPSNYLIKLVKKWWKIVIGQDPVAIQDLERASEKFHGLLRVALLVQGESAIEVHLLTDLQRNTFDATMAGVGASPVEILDALVAEGQVREPFA